MTTPSRIASSSGLFAARPNRNIATQTMPGTVTGPVPGQRSDVDRNTDTYTYFTQAGGTKVLYNGDRQWAQITLLLETAGPVVVGVNKQTLEPILAGSGILLLTTVERVIPVAKGSRLYIASTTANRVQVTIEAYPWQEQIDDANNRSADATLALAQAIGTLVTTITKR